MVSAPKSRSEVAIDQALYNDLRVKTSRQDRLEMVRTLMEVAVDNEPKYRRVTRITQCLVSLSILADACDVVPRLDIPTSPPRNTGFQTTQQDITTGPSEALAPRRSARVAAIAEKRQQQSSLSSPADAPHQAVAPSFVAQSTVSRKRKRSTKATTPKTKKEEQRVASHSRVGDRKCVKPVARRYLGPRNI